MISEGAVILTGIKKIKGYINVIQSMICIKEEE